MNLIQLVSGLPPRVDGIGDYALQLARQLRDHHALQTTFIVGDPSWLGGPVEGFSTFGISERAPHALPAAIDRCRKEFAEDYALLIHFSPYSYQKRGCPLWLQQSLKILHGASAARIHILYHELDWTDRTPLKSGFWLAPLQRRLIRNLTQLVNVQYTNTELHRGKLECAGSGRITLIPNFSTLGEPASNPPFQERRKDVIVFGRGSQRQWTYERGADVLRSLCGRLGLQRIIDIGQPINGHRAPDLGGIPIVRCGRLEAGEINTWMECSVASFMYYPVPLLTKSSVHAASCAHGTIPFIFDDQPKQKSCPGLVTGEDFVPLGRDPSTIRLGPLEELSSLVHRNYQARASSKAAKTFAHFLQSATD
jgi:hypothetical protein